MEDWNKRILLSLALSLAALNSSAEALMEEEEPTIGWVARGSDPVRSGPEESYSRRSR